MTEPSQVELLEAQVMGFLDDATNISLGLSLDDSVYSNDFIRQKVTQVSYNQEILSDIMMKLTRVSIEVTRVATAKSNLLSLEYNRFKSTSAYEILPRDQKKRWVEEQVSDLRGEAERWNMLKRVVSEVKEAVGERSQTMKRLDSDLRLHSKLLEGLPPGVGGATSPSSYNKSESPDLEIG